MQDPHEEQSSDDEYRALVQRLAFAAVNEQRRARRWRIFFLLLTFLYLTPLLFLVLSSESFDQFRPAETTSDKHTALLRVSGVIADGAEASAEHIISGLQDAFEDEDTAGVILEINSPGGSPVQSAYIYDEILRLRAEHQDTPLYAVVTDIAASGAYYIAAAADRIYVNRSSLVGSIGVRLDSFGLVDLIDKIGVERRLMTAGEHKALLDPFLPENLEEKQHLQVMLDEVHQHFIDSVKQGRGDRLQDDENLFSGLVWSGERAIEIGLVDEIGSREQVARDVIGEEELVDFTPRELLLDRLASRVGASAGQFLEQRLLGQFQLQ